MTLSQPLESNPVLTPLHDDRQFVCPGESAGISHSVHLARLAAGFRACADCRHRMEGAGPVQARSKRRSGLVRTDRGFRGDYLNEFDRRQAVSWAMAFGALLWDENIASFTAVRKSDVLDALPRRTAPTIVVGYDERPASPDILTGVMLGLSRMSCSGIDIGLTTEPCLAFAVQHLAADAGIYVTGAGGDPVETGFQVRLRCGLPPAPAFLERWQAVQREPIARRSRSSGALRAFPAEVPYEANLWKHFHALRPLHAVCGTSSVQLAARLHRLFARLPGRLTALRLPTRQRSLDPHDPDVERIAAAVREHSAHFGVVIDEDTMTLALIDERGEFVETPRWMALFARHLIHEHGPGNVIVTENAADVLGPVIRMHGGKPIESLRAECAARMLAEGALAAIESEGRVWLGGAAPVCDAIVTLAQLMQAQSHGDAPLSELLRNAMESAASRLC
jgi:phosphomannomutase